MATDALADPVQPPVDAATDGGTELSSQQAQALTTSLREGYHRARRTTESFDRYEAPCYDLYDTAPKALFDAQYDEFLENVLPDLAPGSSVSDMEVLSPRTTNVPARPKTVSKIVKGSQPTTTSATKLNREKNHPSEPPAHLQEPSWPAGQSGKRYAIKNVLGRGGFAICYEAEEEDENNHPTGNVFALKIVRRVHPLTKMMEKFKTELQIHSKMRHPNIVEFYRAFTHGESTHVVLGLCPNGSLMEMVKKRKFLTAPEVRRYIIQICGAIKYMHHRNIIHRDLKMGNIFLDNDMNVKIGDFGLAALLISDAEISHNRRRTMCGTPNYIAPEVLEKSKRGHDYKVDIWSLGVIIFAMLTGYPPFQAKTTDEIYKKVKARDYEWPLSGKCADGIPSSAKDLVRDLLVGADDRPEPDAIVSQEFLTSGTVLEEIPSSAKFAPPPVSQFGAVATTTSQQAWKRQWVAVCKSCGVGQSAPNQVFPLVGDNQNTTIYRECQDEEDAGRTPLVPLPENIAYIPFLTSDKKASRKQKKIEKPSTSLGTAAGHSKGSTISIPSIPDVFPRQQGEKPGNSDSQSVSESNSERERSSDTSVKSFAAVRGESSTSSRGTLSAQRLPTKANEPPQVARTQSGLLSEVPIRPSSSSARTGSAKPGTNTTGRLTRSQTVRTKLDAGINDQPVQSSLTRSNTTNALLRGAGGKLANVFHRKEGLEANEHRLTSQVEELLRDSRDSQRGALPLKTRSNLAKISPETLLIAPQEVAESLTNTKSSEVIEGIQDIVQELQSALEGKSPTAAKAKKTTGAPIVVKWVDYTNKFGIGYILSDGSIGCLFNSDTITPSTSIVVRGGERHMHKKRLETYTERHQILPIGGQAIEFYENLAEGGLKRVFVEPKQFVVQLAPGDTLAKLAPGTSSQDNARKRRVLLFNKFAQYMTNGAPPPEEDDQNLNKPGYHAFVKFYQRLGDVGVWNFGDGSYQINFPDHTKIIMSADGKHCDFYHLPERAAKQLKEHGTLPRNALDKRSLLSFPTQNLTQGMVGNKSFAGIAAANDLEKKIEFIETLMSAWLINGGIGRTNPAKKHEWFGMRENKVKDDKKVWVTVGAYGGDHRSSSSSSRMDSVGSSRMNSVGSSK
ncbi:MAG: hypothetical protein M4579_003239 [Chaenotheca gracillima]|nr:MAG: hypothetical protein M4579_003239 [Chaenotheca gracillima]